MQTGNNLEIAHYDPVTGELMARGTGTVDGIRVHIGFGNSPNYADVHLTPDGRNMLGIFYKIDGPHHGQWSYIGPKCPPPSEQASGPAATPIPGEPTAPKTSIPADHPNALAGAWRDGGAGGCHLIVQNGNNLNVTNYDPKTNLVVGYAFGSVDAGHIQLVFRNSATADLHLTLLGTFLRRDGLVHGQWSYVGPSCPDATPSSATD